MKPKNPFIFGAIVGVTLGLMGFGVFEGGEFRVKNLFILVLCIVIPMTLEKED